MQKKITAVLAALTLGASASMAETLSPEQALARIYGPDGAARPARAMAIAAQHPSLVKTIETTHGKPAAYIFTTGGDGARGGWLVAGADDLASPLLGYGSGKTDPDRMPPQMKWWLEGYARQIAAADSLASQNAATGAPRLLAMPGEEAAISQTPARIVPKGQIGPLLKTTWDQNDPYNRYTPEYSGEHTPTGCVATAMAQVMNYFEYPAKGKGTGYATLGAKQFSRSLDVTFDWGNMADDYLYTYRSEAQKDAVANLMVTCGYAVNMAYAPGGSGAADIDMIKAMVNTFDYDNGTWLYYRDHYTLEEWEQMLVDNLTNVGPIYYSGQAPEGGHAFVCDGYDGNGYFNFNWGWSGYFNGYFAIDALNPTGQGTGGFEGGYNTSQTALLGARRPVEGSKRPQIQLSQYGELDASLSGNSLTLKCKDAAGGSGWFNMTYVRATVLIGLELENMATGTKTIASASSSASALDTYYGLVGSVTLSIPSSTPDGTYRARMVTKESGYGVWVPALCDHSLRNYVVIDMQGGAASIGHEGSDRFEVESASLDGSLYMGQPGSYTVKLYNGTDATVEQQVAFALISDMYIMASSAPETFTLASKQSLERSVPFELTYRNTFATNTDYTAVLYDPQSMTILYDLGTARVMEDTTLKPSFVNSSVVTPLYYGREGKYSFTIQNPTARTVSYNVTAALLDPDGYIMAMDENNVHQVSVGASATRDFTLGFNFSYYSPNFKTDTEYYFAIIEVAEDNSLSLLDVVDVVTVEADPEAAQMVCHSFALEGDNDNADPSNLVFTAEVSCDNKDVTDYIIIGIWDEESNYQGAVPSDNVTFAQGQHKPIRVGIDFSEATPGARYFAALFDSRSTQLSDLLWFRIKGSSGLGETEVNAPLTLSINTASRTAVAMSGSKITDVKVYNTSGALLNAHSELNGHSACVSLKGLSGMVIVTVTDASGAQVTKKTML